MRASRALSVALLAAALAAADARACEGKNLAPDKPLHIAVESKPTSSCARTSKPGDRLKMHYTGTLYSSCKKFDSSRDRGATFDFEIGAGRVIQGWDEGLVGLCKGAKATLIIPPALGYGDRGAGADIPGGATLNFDVEVVDITEGPPEPNIFKDLDGDEDGKLSKEEVLAFFKKQGRDELPEGLWEKEDKNEDGVISWEEFSGPKGKTAPPLKDEV